MYAWANTKSTTGKGETRFVRILINLNLQMSVKLDRYSESSAALVNF